MKTKMKIKKGLNRARLMPAIIILIMSFAMALTNDVIAQNEKPAKEKEEEPIFKVVEEMPKFPGGVDAMKKFLAENIKYPEFARKKGIQGRVYIQFVIEKDGSVTGGMVLRGIDGGCDEEAARVVRAMPKWIPGTQKGEPVRVQFNLPIQFSLDGKDLEEDKSVFKMDYIRPVEMPDIEGGYDEIIEIIKKEHKADLIEAIEAKKEKDLTGVFVDERPQIEGYEKISDFVKENIKYPEAARKAGIKGTVVLTFVVEKNGSITDLKVRKSIGSGCDEEAMRIAKLMKFTPGKHKGKVVRVPFYTFVSFKLK